MSDFDDRSGIVAVETPWGRWWQTMEDVTVEIKVPQGTKAKDVTCRLTPRHLLLSVKGQIIISGELPRPVRSEESVWTIEDGQMIRFVLSKAEGSPANCWNCLFDGQFEADPFVFDKMQQKLTLERFQRENPGMDFSRADITGNYQGGGPILPQ